MPNLTLHFKDRELLKKVPRDVSISKIVKWIVMSIVLSEDELHKEIQANKQEADEVRKFLQAKVKRLVG